MEERTQAEKMQAEIFEIQAMIKFREYMDYLFDYCDNNPDNDLLQDVRDSICSYIGGNMHFEEIIEAFTPGVHRCEYIKAFNQVKVFIYKSIASKTSIKIEKWIELTNEEKDSIPKELTEKEAASWIYNNIPRIDVIWKELGNIEIEGKIFK